MLWSHFALDSTPCTEFGRCKKPAAFGARKYFPKPVMNLTNAMTLSRPAIQSLRYVQPFLRLAKPCLPVAKPLLRLAEPFLRIEKPILRVEKSFLRVEKVFLQVEKSYLQIEKTFFRVALPILRIEKPSLRIAWAFLMTKVHLRSRHACCHMVAVVTALIFPGGVAGGNPRLSPDMSGRVVVSVFIPVKGRASDWPDSGRNAQEERNRIALTELSS